MKINTLLQLDAYHVTNWPNIQAIEKIRLAKFLAMSLECLPRPLSTREGPLVGP